MDYIKHLSYVTHSDWQAFTKTLGGHRLILFTTKATILYHAFNFADTDVLLFGQESAGVPEEVRGTADAEVVVPMRGGLRSLNLGMAAAIGLSEAVRQTGGSHDER